MISQHGPAIKGTVVPNLLKAGDVLTKRNFLTAMLAAALGAMLLFKSSDLGEGIRRGLSVCSYSVIPALFPFMALSVLSAKAPRRIFLPQLCGP